MTRISVIIPTYKHRDFVAKAIDSVLQQSVKPIEIIVINDGSPDDTSVVLQPFVQNHSITYIEQPNAGQANARNRGIQIAQGDYIALLDDDDFWQPNTLELLSTALNDRPQCVVAYGYANTFGDRTEKYPQTGHDGQVFQRLLRGNIMLSPGQALFRASAIRSIGLFDLNIWGADDWDLLLRLAKLGPFAYVDQQTLNYRLHSANASKQLLRMYDNAKAVMKKTVGLYPHPLRLMDWVQMRRPIGSFAWQYHLDAAKRASLPGRVGHRLAALLNCPTAIRQWKNIKQWWKLN
jgi:glycosyltransferase involved in cell wall biosynthesis